LLRRKRLLLLLTAAALAALAVPSVHWRLVGWARGEPLWRGRPRAYWRAQAAASTVRWEGRAAPSGGVEYSLVFLAESRGWAREGEALARRWLGRTHAPDLGPALPADGPEALPVQLPLLRDADPLVRACAAEALGRLGGAAGGAAPVVQGLLRDRSAVPTAPSSLGPGTVTDAAREALRRIDPAALEGAAP
jgi:hypothetical protein